MRSPTCGASQTRVAAPLDTAHELLGRQMPNVEEAAELMRWSALSLLRAALAEHDG